MVRCLDIELYPDIRKFVGSSGDRKFMRIKTGNRSKGILEADKRS